MVNFRRIIFNIDCPIITLLKMRFGEQSCRLLDRRAALQAVFMQRIVSDIHYTFISAVLRSNSARPRRELRVIVYLRQGGD